MMIPLKVPYCGDIPMAYMFLPPQQLLLLLLPLTLVFPISCDGDFVYYLLFYYSPHIPHSSFILSLPRFLSLPLSLSLSLSFVFYHRCSEVEFFFPLTSLRVPQLFFFWRLAKLFATVPGRLVLLFLSPIPHRVLHPGSPPPFCLFIQSITSAVTDMV